MKKVALVIISLLIGSIIGYWYRDYCSIETWETERQFVEKSLNNHNIRIHQDIYYIGDDGWEDLIFQQCQDFGPV